MIQLVWLCFSTCSGIKEGKAIKRCELMVSFSSPAVAPGAVGGQRPECVGVWRVFRLKNKSLYDRPAVMCLLLDLAPAPAALFCLLTVLLYLCQPYFCPEVGRTRCSVQYMLLHTAAMLLWHESCGYVTPGWYFDNNHSVGNIPRLWKVFCEALCRLEPYKCPPKPACQDISIKYE